MAKIIECVPNISEGRNQQVIDEIVGIIKACPGVTFLDLSSDTSHNRSVLTFIGEPEPMENAVLAMTEAAIRLIDLRKHRGQHPRMGAVDVIPFIPIKEMDMQECVDFSSASEIVFGRNINCLSFYTRLPRQDPADKIWLIFDAASLKA